MSASLVIPIEIAAPAHVVWQAVTDWPQQGEWMLGTTVTGIGPTGGKSVGEEIRAFTGVGRVGFLDTMVVTKWDPPRVCEVEHTGRVVRGTGVFTVEALPRERSRFIWEEHLELPLGYVGKLGWPLVRPAFAAGVRASLVKLGQHVGSEYAKTR